MNKSDIELIKATHEYAEQVWQFRQEILDCDSNSESQFAGCLSLDEATSALDADTEKRLLQNLRSMTDKTVVIVTHRPAALEICDRVIDFTNTDGSESA